MFLPLALLVIAAIDVPQADAVFGGPLQTSVNRVIEAASRRHKEATHAIEGMKGRNDGVEMPKPSIGLTKPTTSYQARPAAPNTDARRGSSDPATVDSFGLRFVLREDNRCFLVELDRPGDHMVCRFRYTSNLSEPLLRSFSKNITVEWYSPSGASIAVFRFEPTHPCAKRQCLVRGTAMRSEAANALHGVEGGAYALCFRHERTSLLSRVFGVFMGSAADAAEEIRVELLDVAATAQSAARVVTKPSREGGRTSSPSPPSGGPLTIKSDRSVDVAKIASLKHRLTLIEQNVFDIVAQARDMEGRQAEFQTLSNAVFTRMTVCGLATMLVMSVVLWVEQKLLKQHLIKKKVI